MGFHTSLLLALTLATQAAGAGVLDSPPPLANGNAPTRVLYRMGPVYHEEGVVWTHVQCTNRAAAPANVVVEIFDEQRRAGHSTVRAFIAPGATVSFVTGDPSALAGAATTIPVALPVHFGKARVSAGSNVLSCTGANHVRTADGSVRELPLALIKRVAFDRASER